MQYKLINGDSAEVLKQYKDNTFDSVVTDPPYGIEFLGKDWDQHTGTIELWEQVFRVLKPGGHLLAFSAARTYHTLATNIESVGFEIRDQIMWIYASGFPKAQDIGKAIDKKAGKLVVEGTGKTKVSGGPQETPNGPLPRTEETIHVPQTKEGNEWSGWKTALKPAHEPIVMARKPPKQSIAKSVQQYGTGALNIDATRIPCEARTMFKPKDGTYQAVDNTNSTTIATVENMEKATYDQGRYPSNVIGEIEGYQKFFYCPKVSRKERHTGLASPEFKRNKSPMKSTGTQVLRKRDAMQQLPTPLTGHIKGGYDENGNRLHATLNNATGYRGNNHPTVKPVALMSYLVRLVTPVGGTVLDPFNGSGSTGMACKQEGMDYVGIDLDQRYIEISENRIEAWGEDENKLDPELWDEHNE